jgi:hypothetical protein
MNRASRILGSVLNVTERRIHTMISTATLKPGSQLARPGE